MLGQLIRDLRKRIGRIFDRNQSWKYSNNLIFENFYGYSNATDTFQVSKESNIQIFQCSSNYIFEEYSNSQVFKSIRMIFVKCLNHWSIRIFECIQFLDSNPFTELF